MIRKIDILSYTGKPLRVLLIPAGEQSPNFQCMKPDTKNLLEFYDARYDLTPDGQFISRYYLETLKRSNSFHGLDLHGGEPDWKIDGRSLTLVLEWAAAAFMPL